MAEDRDSLRAHYRRMRKQIATEVAGLSDERRVERTIDGWSVKDHLAHLASWDNLRADEIIRISAGFESALRMTGQQDEVLNALLYDLQRDLSLAQVLWEWQRSGERLLEAIRNAPAEALEPEKYGEAGLVSTHAAQHAGWIADWRKRMEY